MDWFSVRILLADRLLDEYRSRNERLADVLHRSGGKRR